METIKELRIKCGEVDKNSGWREKVARWISIRITWTILFLFPKTMPNPITALMIIIGIISAFFFMPGRYLYTLMGVVLYHLYLILDACDGEIARYKKVGKNYGTRGLYLDYLGHIIANPLIVMGLAIGAYMNNPTPLPKILFLIIGFITVYSMVINNFMRLKKYEMYLNLGKLKEMEEMKIRNKSLDTKENKFKKEFWEFFRILTFNSIFFFGILNLIPYLVLINGIIFPLQALKRFYYELKTEPGPKKN